MKMRIFKRPDGSLIYSKPSKVYQGGYFINDLSKPVYETIDGKQKDTGLFEQRELTFADCKFDIEFAEYPYFDANIQDIILPDSANGNFIEMFYIEGECSLANLKQDTTWEKVLMPTFLVKEKHLKSIDDSLNSELSKASPDPIAALKLSQQKEAAKKLNPQENEKELLEIAFAGLARSPIDKPLIREKLQARIDELTPVEDKKNKKKK